MHPTSVARRPLARMAPQAGPSEQGWHGEAARRLGPLRVHCSPGRFPAAFRVGIPGWLLSTAYQSSSGWGGWCGGHDTPWAGRAMHSGRAAGAPERRVRERAENQCGRAQSVECSTRRSVFGPPCAAAGVACSAWPASGSSLPAWLRTSGGGDDEQAVGRAGRHLDACRVAAAVHLESHRVAEEPR